MQSRLLFALALVMAAPGWAADSVFVEGAFSGSWGASFPPFIPQIIGPIEFGPMDDAAGIAKMDELRGPGTAAELWVPPAGEKREFYGGDYDYQKVGEFAGCTNGEKLFGVYKDFDGADFGSIVIDQTFPGANPNWRGTFTNAQNQTGAMHGAYQGGGIATPLARVSGQQPMLTSISGASFVAVHGLAPESWVSGFGENLATDVFIDATLPVSLGGVTVVITDSAGQMHNALLYVVSPTQINYVIPAGVATGPATVTATRDGVVVGTETATIVTVAPALFSAASNGAGVAAAVFLRIDPGGAHSEGPIFDSTLAPIPVDLGPEGAEVYLSLYGTGMRNFTGAVTVTIDGISVGFFGPVAQPQFEALDQLNVGPLPRSLAGKGEVDIVVTVDGKQANVVTAVF